MDTSKIPSFVTRVTTMLQEAGFEAWLVGGCVRDMLLGNVPKDWDVTTNARPEQIQEICKEFKTVYENTFGTVTVVNIAPNAADRPVSSSDANGEADRPETDISRERKDTIEEVQVTTYRSERGYSDARHPDAVTYETSLEKDLERRDFTMNAIAYDPIKDIIKDIFSGQKDIKDKIIRSVLYANTRLKEDALRMLRAVRFSTALGFAIESETVQAIEANATIIQDISGERIRDEFVKIIASNEPAKGIDLLQRLGLLKYIIPEIEEGIGCEQLGEHIYDVYNHCLHALQHAADKQFPLDVRLTALFHDIGKPRTRRFDGSKAGGKGKYTFYGHEVVGAKMTKIILEGLKFSRETVSRVTSLVRNHMFFSDTEQITLSAVRRIIQKVGPENIWFLMEVRECDRVGMKKVEAPYRLRKYHAMIEEALRDPISVSQLAIDGNYLMNMELHPPTPENGGRTGMKPGPRMGWMLHALLEEVLENPALNTIEKLSERVKDLDEQDDETLKKLGEKAKQQKDLAEQYEIEKLHQKHNVKTTKKAG
jgi:putative nucleotidyltransferase with HDIG domain